MLFVHSLSIRKNFTMTRKRVVAVLGALSVMLAGLLSPAAQAATPTDESQSAVQGISAVVPDSGDPRIANWQQLQFGLFMHWGVYSMFEGRYKGQDQTIGYPEQIKAWMKIPKSDYLAEAAKMAAPAWNAAKICSDAKAAGMKYVMITSKHHDGFAMWDTETTDYNVVKQTAFGQDPMRQLADECAKIDMKLAFYFSIIDWEKHEPEPYGNVNPISDEHHQYNLRQIEELLTNYGPIAEFWFDMGAPTAEQSQQMADKVHQLQPDTTVVNSRVWNDKGDFEVGGDNAVPSNFRMGPWESILSIFPSCWSYCSTSKANRNPDQILPKTKEALSGLITVISGGGQYAYNIGPKGDGSIDPFDQQVLDNLAAWHSRHPHAIDGAQATWFRIPSWGRITAQGNSLYFFPSQWTAGQKLSLSGLANRVQSVSIDGTDRQLPFSMNGTTLEVTLEGNQPDEFAPVIKVELDGSPMMVPTQTHELNNGQTNIPSSDIVSRSSAKGHSNVAHDAYVVDRSGKTFRHVEFEIELEGWRLDPAQLYKVSFGDQSVVVSGADLKEGAIGEGFTLEPNQVKRLRIELANPPYYATPMDARIKSVLVNAFEDGPVLHAPRIVTHPSDVDVKEGEDATFIAGVSARPAATYQWYRTGTDGVVTPIAGATSRIYTFAPKMSDSGASFHVVASNNLGEATSNKATLTVRPNIVNLALWKETRQSSTAWEGEAYRAVDGLTNGYWDNDSVTHTADTDLNPWWEADLEDTYRIGTVNVWNRAPEMTCQSTTVPCSDRLKDFYVIASTTPVAGAASLEEMISGEGVKAVKVDGVGGYPSTVSFDNFEARYITVVLPGRGTPLSLAEVEVFGKPAVEAPTFSPIQASGRPAEHFSSAGDGQSRTITARVGTEITLETSIGGAPAPTVEWQRARSGGNQWETIENATGNQYVFTLSAEDNGTTLRAVARNSEGEAYSQLIEVKAQALPTIGSFAVRNAEGQDIALSDESTWKKAVLASGTQVQAQVSVDGLPAPSIQWQKGVRATDGSEEITWSDIEGATGDTYAVTVDAAAGDVLFRAHVSNEIGSVDSTPVLLSVEKQQKPEEPQKPETPEKPEEPQNPQKPESAQPSVQVSGTDGQSVRPGQEITFTASGFAANEKLTFTVHSTPIHSGVVRADASGRASVTWVVPSDYQAGEHRVVVTGENGTQVETSFTVVSGDKGKKNTFQKVQRSRTKSLAQTGADSALAMLTCVLFVGGISALTVVKTRRKGRM